MLFNMFTVNGKYSLHNRENLLQENSFSQVFNHFELNGVEKRHFQPNPRFLGYLANTFTADDEHKENLQLS